MILSVNPVLLADIKNSLQMDWIDEEGDKRISGFIADGIAYLNRKLGAPADCSVPGAPRTLLKEYVRYVRDGALDVFENNYRSELLSMQNEKKVNDLVEKALQSDCGCYPDF